MPKEKEKAKEEVKEKIEAKDSGSEENEAGEKAEEKKEEEMKEKEKAKAEKEKIEEKGKAGEGEKAEGKEEKAEIKPRKEEAIARGVSLPISTKHAVAVCAFIKGKTIEQARELLHGVIRKKVAVPMKGELPHRKGRIMSGRYPVKTSQYILKLLKQLEANAQQRPYKPYRRFGVRRLKRTHIVLKVHA